MLFIFTYMFTLSSSLHFSLQFRVSIGVIYQLYFGISSGASLLDTTFCSLSLFIFILQDIFKNKEFYWTFLVRTLNMWFHCLPASIFFWWEVSCNFYCHSHECNVSFKFFFRFFFKLLLMLVLISLLLFSFIFFCQQFDCDVSHCGFLCIYVLWNCRASSISEQFSLIISYNVSSAYSLSPLLLKYN